MSTVSRGPLADYSPDVANNVSECRAPVHVRVLEDPVDAGKPPDPAQRLVMTNPRIPRKTAGCRASHALHEKYRELFLTMLLTVATSIAVVLEFP
eukprot:2990498-Pyramimonas_sp.AAC.1